MDSSSTPNIIFIFADDLGYGDMGCYGATKITTPNVDQIAAQGIHFMDAHSSSAVCTPSRYSVMTGRYCWRSKLKRWVLGGFGAPLIDPERMTVAGMLKKKGYHTAAIGKWHLGLDWTTKPGSAPISYDHHYSKDPDINFTKPLRQSPTSHGFDYFFGIAGSLDMPPYVFIENDRPISIPTKPKSPLYNQQRMGPMADDWKDEEVDTTHAKKAVEFIETHAKESPDQPFFLYLATAAPHRPCDIQPDFVKGKSQAGDRGDMVVLFDWVVGQVEETLKRLDLIDNTLIVITSDNGARLTCADGNDYGHRSCGDLRGQKADIWDGGHREPFIARWPGKIPANAIEEEVVCLVDMFATFAEIVGGPLGENVAEDSFNFLPALLQKPHDKPARDMLIHHSGNGMFSVRKGKWKFIPGLGSGGFSRPQSKRAILWMPKGQLYDMKADHRETRNLWKERQDIVKELTAELEIAIKAGRTRPT